MTEAESISFFVRQTADLVRSMPLRSAASYLRGALALAGGDDSVEPLRVAYQQLSTSDHQLELIAGGQLRLELLAPVTPAPSPVGPHHQPRFGSSQ